MKAYRPYETFGMIDTEKSFKSVEEIQDHYKAWLEDNSLELSPITSEDDRVVFTGTNLRVLNELVEDGVDKDEAMEESLELLVVTDCTPDEVNELYSLISL